MEKRTYECNCGCGMTRLEAERHGDEWEVSTLDAPDLPDIAVIMSRLDLIRSIDDATLDGEFILDDGELRPIVWLSDEQIRDCRLFVYGELEVQP